MFETLFGNKSEKVDEKSNFSSRNLKEHNGFCTLLIQQTFFFENNELQFKYMHH